MASRRSIKAKSSEPSPARRIASAALVAVVTDDLIAAKGLQAGRIVGALAKLVGGGGGGRPHLATAGGKDTAQLDEALRRAPEIVRSAIR